MKQLLVATAFFIPIAATTAITPSQLRVATNDYIGTNFLAGNPSDQNFTTRFDAGTHTGFMRPYKGGLGLGTGQTSVTITFDYDSIIDVVINTHMDTTENPTAANNAVLEELAIEAQGPNFGFLPNLPQTSYNFALAVDWTMRIAEQPFQFVYANSLRASNGNLDLEDGIHIVTVPARNDNLTLALGVTNGNIDVASISHRDTPGIVDHAVVQMVNQLVHTQELSVDIVTGATNTSVAVIEALEEIVAGNQTIKEPMAVSQLTREYITTAQTAWGQALVGISQAYANGDDFVTIAVNTLNDLYAFDYGVLFAPTLTTFRNTWADAADYFIGEYAGTGNQLLQGDGFALLDHSRVVFEEGSIVINGNQAIWNGYVHIYDSFNALTTVAKSFGYMIGRDGNIRINLHHSQIPHAN